MLKITDYADKLIEGLDSVDYIEKVKVSQKNWIGRSEGAEVDFTLKGKEEVHLYNTSDTLFGATYMVVSRNIHILINIRQKLQTDEIMAYREAPLRSLILKELSLQKKRQVLY